MDKDSRQADVLISEAMLAAGLEAYFGHDPSESAPDQIVSAIFDAMLQQQRQEHAYPVVTYQYHWLGPRLQGDILDDR